MSRKPIQIELKGLKTPRERVWEAIVNLDATVGTAFTKAVLYRKCEPAVTRSVIDDYLHDLTQAGYLKLNTELVGGVYTLLRRQGDAPRVTAEGKKVTQGSGTEAMWRAMKVLPVFDYTDIAKAATLGALVVKPATAKAYVVVLARAGYLTQVRAAKPGTPAKHRLTKNTGMHAPAITRMKAVFDRNTGESTLLQTAQEVCDGLE